jgi:hypothetical protein
VPEVVFWVVLSWAQHWAMLEMVVVMEAAITAEMMEAATMVVVTVEETLAAATWVVATWAEETSSCFLWT